MRDCAMLIDRYNLDRPIARNTKVRRVLDVGGTVRYTEDEDRSAYDDWHQKSVE